MVEKRDFSLTVRAVRVFLAIGCCLFVLYQSWWCLTKFIRKPIGTAISYRPTPNETFPSLTICPANNQINNPYDYALLLDKYGITLSEYSDLYSAQPRWHSNLTTDDTSAIYLEATNPTDSLLDTITMRDRHGNSHPCLPRNCSLARQNTYTEGRCITVNFNQEVKEKGIVSVTIDTTGQASVNIHHEGQFHVGTNRMILLPSPPRRKQYDFSVDFEVIVRISTKNNKCSTESTRFDECFERTSVEMMTQKVGCTVPSVENNTNICKNGDKAKAALDMYRAMVQAEYDECIKPCHLMKVDWQLREKKSLSGASLSRVKLLFPREVKVTEDYEVYSFLSMMAEVGGYVGLFLGCSIMQLVDVLDCLCKQIYQPF